MTETSEVTSGGFSRVERHTLAVAQISSASRSVYESRDSSAGSLASSNAQDLLQTLTRVIQHRQFALKQQASALTEESFDAKLENIPVLKLISVSTSWLAS